VDVEDYIHITYLRLGIWEFFFFGSPFVWLVFSHSWMACLPYHRLCTQELINPGLVIYDHEDMLSISHSYNVNIVTSERLIL